MRSTCTHAALLMFVMLVTRGTTGHAQGAAVSWLDETRIGSWNTPGQAVPAAPKLQGSVDLRCRDSARSPQVAEDKKVRDRGWDLVDAFQGGWQVIVVRGTAGYDGMCRPVQYQDFVFVRGTFAGTLAVAAAEPGSRAGGAASSSARCR